MKKRIIVGAILTSLVITAPLVWGTVTAAFRASGVQMPKNTSTPVATGSYGVWVDNTAKPNLRYDDGTDGGVEVATAKATTKGDISVYNGTNWQKLASGTNGTCLVAQADAGVGAYWGSCSGGGGGSGTVTSIIAGTGLSGGTITTSGTIAIDSTVATLTGTQTLTNKTISGSSNTLSSIANASLTNSAVTVSGGTGLSGGGSVSLGGSTSISMPNTGPGSGTIGGSTAYINSITLDAQGRVTAAATGTPGGGSTTLQGAYTNGSAGTQVILETATNGPIEFKGPSSGNADIFQIEDNATNLLVEFNGQASNPILTLTQTGATSSTPGTIATLIGGAHTTIAASTEAKDIYFNLARTVQFATGALTNQRAFQISAPTYAFVGASTLANAATMYITGAPVAGTNATITNSYALWIAGGASRFDGAITAGTAATISIKSSATANSTIGTTVDTSVDYTNGGSVFQINNNGASLVKFLTGTFGGGFTAMNVYYSGSLAQGWQFNASNSISPVQNGDITPQTDLTSNRLGNSSTRWASVWAVQHAGVIQTIAAAPTVAVVPASGEEVRITLNHSTAITSMTINAGVAGEIITVKLTQDSTGGAALIPNTWTNVQFVSGTFVTTITANAIDTVTLRYDTTSSKWLEISRAQNIS